MSVITKIQPCFVSEVPGNISPGILCITTDFNTIIHTCCCGCGREVVAPIGLTDWIFAYDGETVTVAPSFGNWNFPCSSHYSIIRNNVVWHGQWPLARILAGRRRDQKAKRRLFSQSQSNPLKKTLSNIHTDTH